MCYFVISITFSFIQDESDEPELESVAVGLLTVISDHATVQSPIHYHPVRISLKVMPWSASPDLATPSW